jgi:hypothetical protein
MSSVDFLHSSASGIVLAIVTTSIRSYTHPANAMVIRNSAIKILTASSTPCWPLYCSNNQFPSSLVSFLQLTASPHIGTLPINTKSAPSANALNMSLPLLTPPSNAIGILPLATEAQSRRLSSVAGTPYRGLWSVNYKCESVIHDLHRAVGHLMQSQ